MSNRISWSNQPQISTNNDCGFKSDYTPIVTCVSANSAKVPILAFGSFGSIV